TGARPSVFLLASSLLSPCSPCPQWFLFFLCGSTLFVLQPAAPAEQRLVLVVGEAGEAEVAAQERPGVGDVALAGQGAEHLAEQRPHGGGDLGVLQGQRGQREDRGGHRPVQRAAGQGEEGLPARGAPPARVEVGQVQRGG